MTCTKWKERILNEVDVKVLTPLISALRFPVCSQIIYTSVLHPSPFILFLSR